MAGTVADAFQLASMVDVGTALYDVGNGGSEVTCKLPPTPKSLSAVSAESQAWSDCLGIAGQGEVTVAEPEVDGAQGSEVFSTVPASLDSDGEVNELLNGLVDGSLQPASLPEGEVICTSSDGQQAVEEPYPKARIKCQKPIEFIKSHYPIPLSNSTTNRHHHQHQAQPNTYSRPCKLPSTRIQQRANHSETVVFSW